MEIIIIGDGQFGSALAHHFSINKHRVHLLGRQSPWPEVLSKKTVGILAVPTQLIPEAIAQRATHLLTCFIIISAAKGLLKSSMETPLQFISKSLKRRSGLAVMSGPSFAEEISKGLPAALVISSREKKISALLSREFNGGAIRFYSSVDPLGVEMCGALKNVYAILAGMCSGLGLGESARASLNTRALAELSRFVRAGGGKSLTVFGLAGVGDLSLTCSSEKSRNFRFGKMLAETNDRAALLKNMGTVEGYWTAFAAAKMAKSLSIRAPLAETAHQLLFKEMSFDRAFKNLMARKTRGEFD